MSEAFVCEVCGARESFVGNRVKVFQVGERYFCEDHLPKEGPTTGEIKVSQATQEQKLTSITESILQLKKVQDQQLEALKSIRGMMTFFVVLMIIGIIASIIASCV
jgi:hypothetical protein